VPRHGCTLTDLAVPFDLGAIVRAVGPRHDWRAAAAGTCTEAVARSPRALAFPDGPAGMAEIGWA
jgi:hypothetical protein